MTQVPEKQQPLVYGEMIERAVIDWLVTAGRDDLIKHGVISKASDDAYGDALDNQGMRPYIWFLSKGMIQGDPQFVRLQIACQVCPHVSEKKALAWIMKMMGGAVDPNRARAVLRVVRSTLLEAGAKDAADAQMLAAMKECRRQALKSSSHQPEYPPPPVTPAE